MKHLKAYTFEELLCEIPELEKYKHELSSYRDEIKKLLIHFARYNNMKYLCCEWDFITDIFTEKEEYFLFEKL